MDKQKKVRRKLAKVAISCIILAGLSANAEEYPSSHSKLIKKASTREKSTQAVFLQADPDALDGKSLEIRTVKPDNSLWGFKDCKSPVTDEKWTLELRVMAVGDQDGFVRATPNYTTVVFNFSDGKGIYGAIQIGTNHAQEGEYPAGNIVWINTMRPKLDGPGWISDCKFVVLPNFKYHIYRLVATGKSHPENEDIKELKVFIDGTYKFSIYGYMDAKSDLSWGNQKSGTAQSKWDYIRWKNGAAYEPGKEPQEKWWDGNWEGQQAEQESSSSPKT